LKIAINYFSAANKGGIGVYSRCLVKALLELDKQNEYHLLCRKGEDHRPVERYPNVRLHRLSGRRVWFEQVRAPLRLRGIAPDVYFSPDFTLPVISPWPAVVTVHDLSFVRFPKSISRKARLLYRTLTPRAVRKAARVVSVSEFTRDELSHEGWGAPENYRVIWSGLRAEFHEIIKDRDFSKTLQKYNLFDEYLLFVGLLEGRKNLGGVLEAYRIVFETMKTNGDDPPHLILAGGQGHDFDDIWEAMKALDMEDWVHYLEYPPDKDLRGLYHGATMFLYPSFYEGFGFPPLEAMAQGTPVVTSNVGAMKEIHASHALAVNPKNPQAIADAALEILEHPERRAELSQQGVEYARRFTWSAAAKKYLELFKEVAGQNG